MTKKKMASKTNKLTGKIRQKEGSSLYTVEYNNKGVLVQYTGMIGYEFEIVNKSYEDGKVTGFYIDKKIYAVFNEADG